MPMMHITLRDGFRGNHVIVAVDGKTVFDRRDVRTDLRISRADGVDAEVAGSTATVVATVDGSRSASTTVDVEANPYLAIDIADDNAVRFQSSAEPFRFL